MQRANPLSPVKSADERSEESATCPSVMKWSEGVILGVERLTYFILDFILPTIHPIIAPIKNHIASPPSIRRVKLCMMPSPNKLAIKVKGIWTK